MRSVKARIENGRYVIDEPANLPEGAEVELQVVAGDELDEQERAQLHQAILQGLADAEAGYTMSAEESLSRLKALRCNSK